MLLTIAWSNLDSVKWLTYDFIELIFWIQNGNINFFSILDLGVPTVIPFFFAFWCGYIMLHLGLSHLHFQAGKGRTGLMVCSYLVYTGMSAEEALQLYAHKRTTNNEGVSHIR